MPPRAERPAPLVLIATPLETERTDAAVDSYAAVAGQGQRLLGAELSRRLARFGAATVPLPAERPGPTTAPFHWGRWFASAARQELEGASAADRPLDAIGYAGSGSLALVGEAALDALLSPIAGEVVANNRFSADAFVLAGDTAQIARGLDALEDCASDNAAPRRLEEAGFRSRDLGAEPWARFDVDTPLDLALLRLATRIEGTRPLDQGLRAFLEMARLPGGRPLLVPHLEQIGSVVRDRQAELVVAGRVPASTWAHLETETACRVRAFVEERGMRSAPGGTPRSILAALMVRSSPAELVTELGRLGDAVVLDTRVVMAALARSAASDAWPPAEERYASDFGDASRIGTAWLRELVEAATSASVPFLLGGHALVSDGLRLIVAAAWQGR